MIERAYLVGEVMGIAVWCFDEAGPYSTLPYGGSSWQSQYQPAHHSHEYERQGTAKILTLFHPADGKVKIQGVTHCPNTVLHAWLKQALTEILDALPPATDAYSVQANHLLWQGWHEGLTQPVSLGLQLPPLRVLLILDNLVGHKTPTFVIWLLQHGILPLYTPLGGSWLNMSESIQRLLKRRALDGQHPLTPQQIIRWFEQTALAWNRDPTPFIWNGKRRQRRQRARGRCHPVGGSASYTRHALSRRKSIRYGSARDI